MYTSRSLVPALFALAFASAAFAQTAAPAVATNPIIYPAKGQSAEKQAKDKSECYTWATGQTGYDPVQAIQQSQANQAQAQQTAQQAQQTAQQQKAGVGGERARGAVGGALVGTAIGAIAGDAGKGAAIGATAGVVGGGASQRQKNADIQKQQQTTQQQASQQVAAQQAASDKQFSDYMRAFGACMEGRGYTLK